MPKQSSKLRHFSAEVVDGVLILRIPMTIERADVVPATYLTAREKEVLALVVAGQRNKEIAANVHLSERTVKFHVGNLLRKHHVTTRVELMFKNFAKTGAL